MCDLGTAAAIGLQAAGGAIKGREQADYVNAVNAENAKARRISEQARREEQARQARYDQQADVTFADALGNMSRTQGDAQTSDAAAAFLTDFDNASRTDAGQTGFLLSGQDASNADVKGWIAKEANKAATDARSRIAALATLTGQGAASRARGRDLQTAGDQFNTLSGLRNGSLQVSQMERSIPRAQVTAGSGALGDVLMGAGALAGSGALGGGLVPTPNGMSTQGGLFDLVSDPFFGGSKTSFFG